MTMDLGYGSVFCDIYLTKREMELCKEVAKIRGEGKIKVGVRDTIQCQDKIDPLEAHMRGVRAEYAVSRWLGCPMDTTAYGYEGDKHQADMICNGNGVEVKWMSKPGGHLALATDKPSFLRSDYIVLTCPAFGKGDEVVRIWGGMSRGHFLAEAKVKDFGYGPRLAVHHSKVRPALYVQRCIQGQKEYRYALAP